MLKFKNLFVLILKKISIYFEMVLFIDEELLKEIKDNVVLYFDLLGMNE